MELKLKHLAPYLPYGLRCVANDDLEIQTGIDAFDVVEKKGAVICLSYISDEICGYDIVGDNYKVSDSFTHNIYSSLAPLLLPLSALAEPLPDGTIPIVELAKMAWSKSHMPEEFLFQSLKDKTVFIAFSDKKNCFGYDVNTNSFFGVKDGITVSTVDQLGMFEYLFANHFDVYNLIDAGLATDKRVIK